MKWSGSPRSASCLCSVGCRLQAWVHGDVGRTWYPWSLLFAWWFSQLKITKGWKWGERWGCWVLRHFRLTSGRWKGEWLPIAAFLNIVVFGVMSLSHSLDAGDQTRWLLQFLQFCCLWPVWFCHCLGDGVDPWRWTGDRWSINLWWTAPCCPWKRGCCGYSVSPRHLGILQVIY